MGNIFFSISIEMAENDSGREFNAGKKIEKIFYQNFNFFIRIPKW